MAKLWAVLLVGVTGSLSFGCAAEPTDAESTAGSDAGLIVDQYRYQGETLEVSSVTDGAGRRPLDGPDNARLAELLGAPTSGLVVDPDHEHVFWIYENETERASATDEIKSHVVLKEVALSPAVTGLSPTIAEGAPGAAPSVTIDTRLGTGCLTPLITLYHEDSEQGSQISVTGSASNFVALNFNDQASSLTFVSGNASIFQDVNFGGHSITFMPSLSVRLSTCGVSQPYGQVASLSVAMMSTQWWIFGFVSWNDQASSAVFTQTQF